MKRARAARKSAELSKPDMPKKEVLKPFFGEWAFYTRYANEARLAVGNVTDQEAWVEKFVRRRRRQALDDDDDNGAFSDDFGGAEVEALAYKDRAADERSRRAFGAAAKEINVALRIIWRSWRDFAVAAQLNRPHLHHHHRRRRRAGTTSPEEDDDYDDESRPGGRSRAVTTGALVAPPVYSPGGYSEVLTKSPRFSSTFSSLPTHSSRPPSFKSLGKFGASYASATASQQTRADLGTRHRLARRFRPKISRGNFNKLPTFLQDDLPFHDAATGPSSACGMSTTLRQQRLRSNNNNNNNDDGGGGGGGGDDDDDDDDLDSVDTPKRPFDGRQWRRQSDTSTIATKKPATPASSRALARPTRQFPGAPRVPPTIMPIRFLDPARPHLGHLANRAEGEPGVNFLVSLPVKNNAKAHDDDDDDDDPVDAAFKPLMLPWVN